jgi:hypothetical protein
MVLYRKEYILPTIDKLIQKMKRQPNGIRPEEAEKVLKAFGYEPVAYVVDLINRLKP